MKRILNLLVSLLCGLVFLLGSLHLLRVGSPRGMLLRSAKSFSEALAAFIALAGLVSGTLAVLLRAPLAGLAGIGGALLSALYIGRVTRQSPVFTHSIGKHWPDRLAQKDGMLRNPWTWRMPAPAQKPRWERDLPYRTLLDEDGQPEMDLLCDLWRPPDGLPLTGLAVVYVHGGGYFTSRKDFGTRPFFAHLAGQGHVIMDIDYRLAPQADLFTMLDDVLHAVAWLKDNAEWLGVDPERIVLCGGSAGAHLALLAAYAPNHPRLAPRELQEADLSVRGVVSYYGIIDLAATYYDIQGFFGGAPRPNRRQIDRLKWLLSDPLIHLAAWVRDVDPPAMREYLHENTQLMANGLETSMNRLVGGPPSELPEVYRLVSPLSYAGPGCPATLLIQGEHDYLLPVGPAQDLQRRLAAAGVPAVYLELPQTDHTFDLFLPVFSPPAQAALYHVDRFLAWLADEKVQTGKVR